MLGAIAGDIIGSVYEWRPLKMTDFPLFQAGSRFTDDSVLAVALAIYRARTRAGKEAIREETAVRFHYDLSRTLNDIRPGYSFDVSCQGSVPEAILAFLESDDYETAVRLAISLGGDSDTMACIAGAIAEAYYGGVPPTIAHETRQRLSPRPAHYSGPIPATVHPLTIQQLSNSTINYYDNP
ncbi:MAG: ADP-ribosylglycohydrolase family protein [Chloroflexota bacterium]